MPHLLLNTLASILMQAEEEGAHVASALPEPIFLNYIWAVLALPLLACIINGLFGKKLGKTSGWIATGLVGAAFLLAIGVFFDVLARNNADPHAAAFQYTLYTWIPSGDFKIDIAFLVDQLTAIMLMVVLSVGTLVHLYSNTYLADDERVDNGFARFFTYLPLFVFSMLILVLANNLLLLFVGWEAVGLSSYLLIGFWFAKKSASDAAKKAFIVNRIGDFGFASVSCSSSSTSAASPATSSTQTSSQPLSTCSKRTSL